MDIYSSPNLSEEESARVQHWLSLTWVRCGACNGREWVLDRGLYALPGFKDDGVMVMVLVTCKTCYYARLFDAQSAGLIFRGDIHAPDKPDRKPVPPPPGFLPKIIFTLRRIVAYIGRDPLDRPRRR